MDCGMEGGGALRKVEIVCDRLAQDRMGLIQLLLYNSWIWEGHIAGIGDFGNNFLS